MRSRKIGVDALGKSFDFFGAVLWRALRCNPDMKKSGRFSFGHLRVGVSAHAAMDADILGGMEMGFVTVLVLSGHTKVEEISRYAYQPNFVITSLAHIPNEICKIAGLGKCTRMAATG
jgi:hypothetical protein